MQSNITKLDRRAVLTGSAATAAALAASTIPAPAASNPDAELIRLREELDLLVDQWIPIHAEMRRTHEIWHDELKRRGLNFYNNWKEVWEVDREVGAAAASDANNAHLDRIETVNEAIRAIQPQTVAGLAAWAVAMAKDCVRPWEWNLPRNELDWEKEKMLELVDVIDRMAGRVS